MFYWIFLNKILLHWIEFCQKFKNASASYRVTVISIKLTNWKLRILVIGRGKGGYMKWAILKGRKKDIQAYFPWISLRSFYELANGKNDPHLCKNLFIQLINPAIFMKYPSVPNMLWTTYHHALKYFFSTSFHYFYLLHQNICYCVEPPFPRPRLQVGYFKHNSI